MIYTVHGFAHPWNTRKPNDIFLEHVERLLAHKTDLMLFQSSEDYENAKIHKYKTQLELLGNGVGDEWFALPTTPPRGQRLRALFVGRLIREKGIVDLLEALITVPDVELTVVGEQLPSDRGGLANLVSEVVSQAPLRDRVCCTGSLTQAQLREVMTTTDLVILPSYREGVPRSLIEGLAAGRPLLATDTQGCRILLTNGVNGYLVPVARPDLLAEALKNLSELSPSKLVAMGLASKQRALAWHKEEMIFKRLAAAYVRQGIHPRKS